MRFIKFTSRSNADVYINQSAITAISAVHDTSGTKTCIYHGLQAHHVNEDIEEVLRRCDFIIIEDRTPTKKVEDRATTKKVTKKTRR